MHFVSREADRSSTAKRRVGRRSSSAERRGSDRCEQRLSTLSRQLRQDGDTERDSRRHIARHRRRRLTFKITSGTSCPFSQSTRVTFSHLKDRNQPTFVKSIVPILSFPLFYSPAGCWGGLRSNCTKLFFQGRKNSLLFPVIENSLKQYAVSLRIIRRFI